MTDYRDLRVEYSNQTLNESDLAKTPLEQFQKWMLDASQLPEPNAMIVATANNEGQPSTRHVLLKEANSRGFIFFTNYKSRKGQEIAENPKVSLVFPWFPIFRQVIVVGGIEKISREDSENYFHSRPHDSQLAALASNQSSKLSSREQLENRFAELKVQYPDGTQVPLPENWGGYLVTPKSIEFWGGRKSRMHDRLIYAANKLNPDLTNSSDWEISRLSP